MSKVNEPEKIRKIKNSNQESDALISETGLEMSEIISVLEGKAIAFEVDKSVRTQTNEIVNVLRGDDGFQEADKEKEKTDVLLDELQSNMYKVLQEQSVEYYIPLQKSAGFKGKIIYKIRSSVRKFLEYIFAPILKQQNSLNSWIARTAEKNVELLQEYPTSVREECIAEIKMQEKRNQILEEKLMEQEQILQEVLKEIEKLKQNQGNQK